MHKLIINIIDTIFFTIACMVMLVMGCVLGAFTNSMVVYASISGTALLLLGVQAVVEEGVLQ